MTNGSVETGRRRRVVVVGSINMDLVFRTHRFPRPGETVPGQSLRQISGGKGANQAVAAARLGADVVMIGRVGNDSFGNTLREGLRNEGIDTAQVQTTESSSGVAIIAVDDSGQNCITVVAGANGHVSPDDVKAAESAIAAADVLLLQFEIPMSSVVTAMELAHRHGVKVLVDPAPAENEVPEEIFQADVLCPNETEAETLCGLRIQSPADALMAAKQIHEKTGAISLVTLGNQGVVYCTGPASCHFVPPFLVEVVDTTAAGDAFAAALGVAMAEGMDIPAAVRFASATGALATTRHGAQPSMPTRDEVQRLLEKQM